MKRKAKSRKPTPSEKREFIPECKDCQRERRQHKAKPHKLTPSEIYSLLSVPLPPEAKSWNKNQKRTDIKDAYVYERMNSVLGPDGWHVIPKVISCEILRDVEGKTQCDLSGLPLWDATVSVCVFIPALKKKYPGFGGYQNSDKGDALKGATTDAVGKALSDLVGIEVYKDLETPVDMDNPSESRAYKLGFQCGWVFGKDGLTMSEAVQRDKAQWEDADRFTLTGKARSAETT